MNQGFVFKFILTACLGGLAVPAFAANCSVYTTSTAGGVAAADTSLNTTNVKLNGVDSDDCAGHYDTGDSSLTTVSAFANTNSIFSLTGWQGAAKTNGSTFENATLSGLKFELVSVTGMGSTTGSFTLKVTDTNGASPANLPATIDLAVVLTKGKNVADFYFFNDETVNTSNAGLFTVGFENQNGVLQQISDIDILVRDIRNGDTCPPGSTNCTPQQIPEPGTVALAALALLGAGRVARRRRQA